MKLMKQSSLSKNHLLAYVLILVIPLFLVILLNSLLFRQEAVRIARQQSEDAASVFMHSLNKEIENYAFFTSALMNDLNLQEHARVYTTTADDVTRYEAAQGLQAAVSWFFRFTTSVGSVFLLFEGDRYQQYSNDSSSLLTDEVVRALIDQVPDRRGEVYCFDTLKVMSRGQSTITMAVRSTADIVSRTNLSAVLVSFQINPLNAPAQNYGSLQLLVARNGEVLSSNDASLTGQPFEPLYHTLKSTAMLLSSEIPSTGWTYFQAIPYASLTRGAGIIMRYVYLALVVSLLLFLLYTRTFFANIIRPLHAVIHRMDSVANGDFTVQVQETGPAEFLHLERTFNIMVQRIKALTEQLLDNQREQSRLELEALRYRLNPHFILNTLNSMTIMAGIAKAEALKRMSKAMTNIMRQTLKDDSTLISYAEEKRYLEDYIYISAIRFGNRFTFSMHVDQELGSFCVPTMLLQPLVENAILHGMRGKQGEGTITVSARYKNDHAELVVEDNGVGMTEEAVAELLNGTRKGKEGFTQLGIYSVKRRVTLSYPEIGSLCLMSTPQGGTTVTITIPLIPLEQLHDQDPHR